MWNYRLVRKGWKFSINEAYYDEDSDVVNGITNGVWPHSIKDVWWMLKAFKYPILDYYTFGAK